MTERLVVIALSFKKSPSISDGSRGRKGFTVEIKPSSLESHRAKKFVVTVNYDSLEQAVKKTRKDRSRRSIGNRGMPHIGSGSAEIEMAIFGFMRPVTSEWVLLHFAKHGYRSADLFEILSWARCYPNVTNWNSIVALGSVLNRGHSSFDVPLLRESGSGHRVSFYYLDRLWHIGYRFGAVKIVH